MRLLWEEMKVGEYHLTSCRCSVTTCRVQYSRGKRASYHPKVEGIWQVMYAPWRM